MSIALEQVAVSCIKRLLVGLTFAPHFFATTPSAAQAAPDRPNVLLIAIDDLRPDLGCYGARHVKSPNIDRLSRSGLLFERAYCQQAVCNPSRTSLMTGLRPESIGVTGNHVHFRDKRPDVITLPEYFKNHGYHAQSIGKIYHGVFPDGASKTVWDTMGDPQSWSVPTTRFGPRYYYTEEGIRQAKQSFVATFKPTNPGPDDWTEKLVFGPMTEAPAVADNTLYDGKVADAAVAALAELSEQPDQPFFLAVGFIKPHSPFVAPKKYFDMYSAEEIQLASNTEFPAGAPKFAGHGSGEIRRYTDQPGRGPIPDENQRRMRHAYLACTSFTDAQVGKVLDELERLQLDDNTIVVLFGDHGYHLGEKGLWGKTTNFELDARVPFIVRKPGMKAAGQRTAALTELVDVYPTLVDLADFPIQLQKRLTPQQQLDGKSFAPVLSDAKASIKPVAFTQYPRGGNADLGGKIMGYSMRTDRWRYTEWIEGETGEVVARELYDHRHNAPETVNIADRDEHQGLVARLSKQLTESGVARRRDRPAAKVTVFEVGDGNASEYGYRIPALTVSKKETLLAFCERRTGLHDHAQNDIVVRRSEDSGKSWGELKVIADEGGDSLNDPLAVVLNNGRILLRYKRYPQGVHARNSAHTVIAEPGYDGPKNVRIYLVHSDDDGRTWSKPREVTRQMRRETAIAVGSPGVGIQLQHGPHKGRIVLPNYEVYSLGGGKRYTANSACYSDDGGESWTLTDVIDENGLPGFGNEAQLVELSDGSILMSARSHDGGQYRKLSISRDGGATWSPHRFAKELMTPACMSSVVRHVDPWELDGERRGMLLHSLPHTKNRRSNGTLFASRDGGNSWSKLLTIEPGAFAYSCLTVLPGGNVGCLYETSGYKSIVFKQISLDEINHAANQVRRREQVSDLIRVACIGDSITYGSGVPRRPLNSYPAQLQQLLGGDYVVRNFGVPGAGALKNARRANSGWPRHFGRHVPFKNSLLFHPNVVVVSLGINDLVHWDELGSEFADDYVALIEQYQDLTPPPKIFIWQPLSPLFPGHAFAHDSDIAALNASVAEVAKRTGVQTIDLHAPLIDHPGEFPDAIHPNEFGAARIAEVVAEAITGSPAPQHQRRRQPVARRIGPNNDDRPATGFEETSPGAIDRLGTAAGMWSASAGHAEIDPRHAKTGSMSLHILGGKDRIVEFAPVEARGKPRQLSFWAERWTRRSPFKFRIEQQLDGKWQEIYNGDEALKIGGFHTHVTTTPHDASPVRLRFRATTPRRSGVLIDDVALTKQGPKQVTRATVEQPALPALVGNRATAVARLRIDIAGDAGEPPAIEKFSVNTVGTTNLADVAQIDLFYTGSEPKLDVVKLAGAELFGMAQKPAANLKFTGRQPLVSGANYFWVSYRLQPDASLDGRIDAGVDEVVLTDGNKLAIDDPNPAGAQRLGVAVRRPGDDGVHTYRIPGLATTNKGTLIGVYDIRRRSGRDLPGDIDVGMSRSTDGGQTWQTMQVIMDMGDDPKWRYDGIGDPTVTVDRETNAVWAAATWSHGNRSWVGSGPGMKPEETGQFILVRSDDDGQTWSKPINITRQVKRPEWCFLLQGLGKGFTMLDGTLVIPAQFQDTPEHKRLPRSSFIYSRDRGKTWNMATGAFNDTTEAQLVELEPGKLMINCRYNREPYRVVMTTDDMGQTWQTHPTSRTALIEPRTCMASLIHVDHELGNRNGTRLLFSNPNSLTGRQRMTIKFSPDHGATWPEEKQVLLDEFRSAGYSCMSMIDDETVGILYEGSQAHMTFQRVKLSEVIGE